MCTLVYIPCNVGITIINHPPVITSSIVGMFTIPSHGWLIIVIPTLYDMALGQNFVALVNIKIAGMYGWENPNNIDNNRF